MQPHVLKDTKDMDRALTAEETSLLRSILGGLLWVTATRLDLVADVGVLQSRVTKAKVSDLVLANSIIKKAKMQQYKDVGIIYRHFPTTVPWKVAVIHDASSASKSRSYSQEGVIVLLMPDCLNLDKQIHTIDGLSVSEAKFGGIGHILYVQGSRSKRISYSTSHAETLAAISGLEISSLVSIRLYEILTKIKKPSLQALAAAQERGCDFLSVDAYTDCRDFYELTTGKQNVPQDKSQRVYIRCHREARVVGRLRWTILIPTQSMLADALTKVMVAKQLLGLLTTGLVNFKNEDGHPIEGRRLPPQVDFNEGDLEEGDQKWLNNMVTIKEDQINPTLHYIPKYEFLEFYTKNYQHKPMDVCIHVHGDEGRGT